MPRFPQKNENKRRTQDFSPPPQSGAQSLISVKFPKSRRLLKRKDFFHLYQEKNRFNSCFFSLDYRFSSNGPKLGISAPKSFGKAHDRNRFKRLIREAFRSLLADFPSFEMNVIPKAKGRTVSLEELKKEFSDFKQHSHVKLEP